MQRKSILTSLGHEVHWEVEGEFFRESSIGVDA